MVYVSNWRKFKLLLWKNCLLHWNRKVQLIVELILPVIFIFLLIFIRLLVKVTRKEPSHFKELEINDVFIFFSNMLPTKNIGPPLLLALLKSHKKSSYQIPKFELAYSPNTTDIFETIVKNAALSLSIFKYHGYLDAEDLEDALLENDYLAGVQFDDSKEYPRKLSFALRFPSELRTSFREYAWTWFTMKLFPYRENNGPRNPDVDNGGIPVGYINEGFIQIQHAISMEYIKLASGKENLPHVVMNRFPYPKYISDPLLTALSYGMSLFISLSFIFPCTFITKSITTEKEKQLKEVMKIMGLRNWIHWTAWFVKSFCTLSLSAILITFMIKFKWSDHVAVLTHSSFTAILFFMLIYVVSSICFCFMMATFFNRANTAAAVTGVMLFVAYIPFSYTRFIYDDLTLTSKLALSLISNTALGFAFKVILSFEGSGVGLQWYNIFTPISVDDSLSLGAIIIVMLISCLLYMAICLYVEQIYPGDYGVPKKWNFPIDKEFWKRKERVPRKLMYKSRYKTSKTDFEREPNKPIGIAIRDLRKSFYNREVVKGLSMDIYEDEITVLLGHNGAGKTTVLSMLIGMYPPTSGTAFVNGHNIRQNIDGARESIGICPQHNVLFDGMSVENHIRFFSQVKGVRGQAIAVEVEKYLKIINLKKKAKVQSSHLSGGMKRKLSICCALCGDSKIVICDEPSSGMDPSSRRELWDLLQEEKQGRTVLLTTHFMDEADVLGDRVAILYEGYLKCYGSAFFLKKKYGSGYRLICSKDADCDSERITKLLRKYIPDIEPESEVGTELSYKLPDSKTVFFQEMFEDLELKQKNLKLNGYGISITTMEEVFMRVSADDEYSLAGPRTTAHQNTSFDRKLVQFKRFSLPYPNVQRLRGAVRCFNQWHAMFLKKAYHTYRNKIFLFIQNFMPIFFITTTILISRTRGSYNVLKPMSISLMQYPKTVTVLERRNIGPQSLENKIAHYYKTYVHSYGPNHELEFTGKKSFTLYIQGYSDTLQERVDTRYLAAATVFPDKIIAWFNNQAYHTAPLSLNLVHNAMAKALIDPSAHITISNAPLPYKPTTLLTQLDAGKNVGTQLAMNLCFCMCFVSSFYVLFLIKERECRAKLLQFVGGIQVFTFWLTHFIWDMLTFTLTAMIVCVTLFCFREPGFKEYSQLYRYFFVLVIFAVSVLPFIYFFSYYFSDSAMGFAIMSIISVCAGMALFLVVIILSFPIFELNDTANLLSWIFRLCPHFSLAMALNKLYINEATLEACSNYSCKLLPRCCAITSWHEWSDTGVLIEITYLLATGGVWFLMCIIREYKLINAVIYKIRKRVVKPPPIREYSNDDVEAEKQRITEMSHKEIAKKKLVLSNVSKCYGNFFAVNQISFCVDRGECFGLIGINGAGKTSTFKMLTGDERITFGDAYVLGMNVNTQMNKIYHEIGYCPQFDALLEDLTARETLKIFCLIRGIPKEDISDTSKAFAAVFGFSKFYRKQIKTYSGGNKRKLSAAIAFIGNPSIVYLDEPTTSMDPTARRQLWDIICNIRDTGNSVVLTSHSMDECEALCTRLAIMVNGEFECIGSTQYLKNEFSKGLILKIKVNPNTTLKKEASLMKYDSLETKRSAITLIEDANIKSVKEFVKRKFSNAILQEEYRFILTFYIPFATIKWSRMFGLMEHYRHKLNIEDYSISQTRLEEIFLAFAKFQQEDPRFIQ